MVLLTLILLVIAQAVLLVVLFGFVLVASSFRFPIIILTALVNIADSVMLTVQFWWLFGVWYQSFILGSIAISASVLILGLVVQVFTNSISREKNVRVNVSFMLFGRQPNVFFQILAIAALMAMLFVLYKTYAMSRSQMSDYTIKDATTLFFTVGSLPLLIVSAVQIASQALKPSLDALSRNVFAISSLYGYGLAAWRAAFPFYLFGGTAIVMNYELSLPTVLVVVGAVYATFVIVPLLLGEHLYTLEHNSVIAEVDSLLTRVTHLSNVSSSSSVFEEGRLNLSRQLNRILISLYENDEILRFLAFWRWGPDRAFQRKGNYWVLHEVAANSNNPNQPLSVLDRPWFVYLIGPKKRLSRKFNDSTLEKIASIWLEEIPNWNYRAAIFNDLVMVLEGLESNDPSVACDRARLAREEIAHELPKVSQSIVTAAFLAGYTIIAPVVLSAFKGEIREALRSVLKLVGS